MKKGLFFLLFCLSGLSLHAEMEPIGTYLYAQKDGQDLYLDIYEPLDSAAMRVQLDSATTVVKPTILFVFGGGFKEGSRDAEFYKPWFEALCRDGYRVVSIDYRLGLKGVRKMGIGQRDLLDKAIHMAVEDLYSSVLFLRENSEELGIDTDNIVLAGSSAGAITILQADYERANRTPCAAVLPEGFQFAGVMSFAGAIYSTHGPVKYASTPAPTLLLHGTADKLVNYDQIVFFNIGWFGSHRLVERFDKLGYPYTFIRFKDHGHEIAMAMPYTLEVQKEFILTCVMRKVPRRLDILIDDPRIEAPEIWKKGPEELYK
ncbi:MAG: alpha/beta hydrolase [Bacteroidales bacterium]|nr:alpha/beta hydrolase [Bacteroidales bacterium]